MEVNKTKPDTNDKDSIEYSIDTASSIDSIVYKRQSSIEYSITHIHIPS